MEKFSEEAIDKAIADNLGSMTDVVIERMKQDVKWGPNRVLDFDRWMSILTEEVGEVAKEVNETKQLDYLDPFKAPDNIDKLRAELVQVAAVAVAWIEQIDLSAAKENQDG